VEALVQLIISSSSQDPSVLGNAVRVIWSICSSDNAVIKQRADGVGAVEALVQLLACDRRHPDDVQAAVPEAQASLSSPAAAPSSITALPASSSGAPAQQHADGSGGQALPPAVCAVCSRRGSRQHKLRLCGCCRAVHYCGAGCQQAHWPEHYKECAAAGAQQRQGAS
jgi:hypothetical protein